MLLLDEPFAALDPELRADVRAAVIDLLAERAGPAVILVTHDIDEASGLADRLAVLMDGQIAQIAPPSELLARPRTVAIARFLGLTNLIRGVRDEAGQVRSALGSFRVDGPPGSVVVVARASALRVGPPDGDGPRAAVVRVSEQVAGVMVTLRIGDEELVGLAEPWPGLARGAAIAVAVDASALHVIDAPAPGR